MVSSSPILAPSRGSSSQFILTTLPLLAVLVYFLFLAWDRPSKAVYNLPDNYTQDQLDAAVEASGTFVSLMDILGVNLFLHVLWTIFAVYVTSFIPKRRHLVGRYLAEGEVTMGDVIYDKSSRSCGGFHDYGYTLYVHPTQRKLVRKRVRVYQPYTRERVAILRLPNRPLSGQAKIDLEIDLSSAAKDRDGASKYFVQWSMIWVIFTLLSSLYVVYQMREIDDPREDSSLGVKILLLVVGLNVPFAFALNWARFLMYRNWMINRGAMVEDNGDARKIQSCIKTASSEDGSDVIPYSILNEDEMSYQGSLPSHSRSLPSDVANSQGSFIPTTVIQRKDAEEGQIV